MAISLSGIGSGLDIQSLVGQLVQAESQAKTNTLNRRASSYQAQISALGSLKSALSKYQDASKVIQNQESLFSLSASSSDDTRLTATVNSNATQGTYTIEVEQLAKANKLSSIGFTSKDQEIGTGTLTISSGTNTFDVPIGDAQKTLEEIKNAINNKSDNASVTATILNVDAGDGSTVSKLVLTARNTGTSNSIKVDVADSDTGNTDMTGLSQLAYNPDIAVTNLAEQVAAKDAVIKIDNLYVTRSSNTIDDAIDGVSLSLKKEELGQTSRLTVQTDLEETKQALTSFAEAYNNLQSVFSSVTRYTDDPNTSGALASDSSVRALKQELRSILRSSIANESQYSTLFEIGLEIDETGQLQVDSNLLSETLKTSPNALLNIFGGDAGIASITSNRLSAFLDSDGFIEKRDSRLNNQLKQLDEEKRVLDERMSILEKTLLKQFIAMDSLVAQYNNTGNYLSNQLANLPGFTKE